MLTQCFVSNKRHTPCCEPDGQNIFQSLAIYKNLNFPNNKKDSQGRFKFCQILNKRSIKRQKLLGIYQRGNFCRICSHLFNLFVKGLHKLKYLFNIKHNRVAMTNLKINVLVGYGLTRNLANYPLVISLRSWL